MAIGLDGQSYLEVRIDDTELPLEAMRFQGVLLSSHMLYHLPMGQLAFIDTHDIVKRKLTLADGTLLTLKLGRVKERLRDYKFTVYNVKVERTDEGTRYDISFLGIQDVWTLQTAVGARVDMTSADALTLLANEAGLDYKGDVTNDTQTWYPMAETNCSFARRIAKMGYIDNRSCMLMGVTLKSELRYINLATVDFKTTGLPHFVHGAEQGIWVTDWSTSNNSGLANQMGGYSATSHQTSIDGTHESEDKVYATRIANTMNVNREFAATGAQVRMFMKPLDAGNNHVNALAAEHQNKRLHMLLSTSTSILTPLDPNVELLEPVVLSNYVADKHSGTVKVDEPTSGFFLTAGKAIYIGPDLSYYERYQLIRDGLNADNSERVT